MGSSGNVTAVSAGQTTITATYQGRSGSVPLTVTAAAPDLIGLELRIGVNVLTGSGPLGLNLNLSDLINGNPIIDLKVFALYSDGSKNDVTSASVINSPLLAIDGQGTLQLVTLLLQGPLNPNHQINVTYGGYTANVNVVIALPVLQSIGLPGTITVNNHNQVADLVSIVFNQGITTNIAANLVPGLNLNNLGAADGLLSGISGLLNALLVGPLINQLLGTVNLAGVLVNADGGLLSNVLVQGALNTLGLGGLPIKATATLNGVTSNPSTLIIR